MPNALNFLRIAHFFEAMPALLLESELKGAQESPLSEQQQEALLDKLSAISAMTRRAIAINEGFQVYLRMCGDATAQEDLRAVLTILDTLIRANRDFGITPPEAVQKPTGNPK